MKDNGYRRTSQVLLREQKRQDEILGGMKHSCIIRNAYRIFVGIPEEYLGENERLQLGKMVCANMRWVNWTHSRLMWPIFTKLMIYQFLSNVKYYIAD